MPLSNRVSSTKSLWTPARISLTILTLSLVAIFGVASCNSNDETARTVPPATKPAADKPSTRPAALASLPANVLSAKLEAASGDDIKLSNYSGKVVLVNLWATWCGPCRSETPELVKLYNEYRDRGFEVVGLSTGSPKDTQEQISEFVRAYGVNYRIGWSSPEVSATLMQGNGSIPQSFIISREGKILKRFIGYSAVATPPQLKQAIEDALKG